MVRLVIFLSAIILLCLSLRMAFGADLTSIGDWDPGWSTGNTIQNNYVITMDPPEPNQSFTFVNIAGEEIGKITWDDATVKFSGDIDASAKMFFDHMLKHQIEPFCREWMVDEIMGEDCYGHGDCNFGERCDSRTLRCVSQ